LWCSSGPLPLVLAGRLSAVSSAAPAVRHIHVGSLRLRLKGGRFGRMVGASAVGRPGLPEAPGEVDLQLYHLGRARGGYLLLANKMDREGAADGLREARRRFPGVPLIPISARTGLGFKEVKRHLGAISEGWEALRVQAWGEMSLGWGGWLAAVAGLVLTGLAVRLVD